MDKKIKSITLYRIDEMPGDEKDENTVKFRYSEYDEKGNLVVEENYDQEGNFTERYERNYDTAGRLIEEVYYLEEDEMAEHKTYEYDENGRVIKARKHYVEGEPDEIIHEYDESGNLTERITINEDEEQEARELFVFENGRLVKEQYFDEDNELVSERLSKFDENGNQVEYTEWNADDHTTTREVYVYDDGRQIASKRYNNKGELLEKLTFELDEKGNRNRIVQQLPDGESTIVIERDDNGHVVKQEEYNSDQELNNRIERELDEHGNVLESRVFIGSPEPGIGKSYTIRYAYEYHE
ncbi:MAG: hypothetical protein K9I94_02665 [Bacteroidales bacterium]|nr:hypothetical protein [Bacteroidales bacterium]